MSELFSTSEYIGDAGYTAFDVQRFVAETNHSETRFPLPQQKLGEPAEARSAFARDRARVLHSFALRRLGAKTQVLSPTAGIDFARNRLTHSLEVAQIGRELAKSLHLSQDIVDTACLTHDIGHPPFGHNGETALDKWNREHGGFEGNAQTLRVLTRLEAKVFDAEGKSRGLNLTRACLDASCKYPWKKASTGKESRKYGYFEEESEIFDWIRRGAKEKERCVEAQAMDLADDIAYSVHDFEDAIVSGYIDPQILSAKSGHDALVDRVVEWNKHAHSAEAIAQAFSRLSTLPQWLHNWHGNREDLAKLKELTSEMIGRFVGAVIYATRTKYPQPQPRYGMHIIVPNKTHEEIAVLQGIAGAFVMASDRRKPIYERQRELLTELLDLLWKDPHSLETEFREDFSQAHNEREARRVIVDQVASLTDRGALQFLERFSHTTHFDLKL